MVELVNQTLGYGTVDTPLKYEPLPQGPLPKHPA